MRPSRICRAYALWILGALGAVLPGMRVEADVFVLDNGGQVRGRWVNRKDGPSRTYVIQTEHGGRLVLQRAQVRRVVVDPPARAEYERIAARYPDTAEGQWELAEWCRQHGLRKERKAHLRRVLAWEPDHARARHALGYCQFRGQWVRPEEIRRQRGYKLHEGQWLLPQEIEILEAQKKLDHLEREWLARLVRWREMLGTDKAADAMAKIRAVRDPHAVKALARLLLQEPNRRIKMLYIDALSRIANRAAIQVLFETTLRDPDEEVFHACVDKIVALGPPHMAEQYTKVLSDPNNVRLNRAAHVLGRLADPSAISALVDALVTTHTIVIPKQSDAYTATFLRPSAGAPGTSSPLGGTGLAAGGQPKVIPRTVTNPQVLEALIKLSGGVNFGFDQRAWKAWLAAQRQRAAPPAEARRDSE